MWRERIIETRKAKGITIKMMSERSINHLPAETITRILNAKTESPGIDTVLDLAQTVGLSDWELFVDPAVLVTYQSYLSLQAEIEALKEERGVLVAEIVALKDEVKNACALEAEIERLRLILAHKEEIIGLHDYYNKRKSNT